MATKKLGISPDLLIHPGETIADLLEERDMTQKELAKRAGVSEPFLSDVINGKKDISKSLAMGLEYAFGVPSSFWLNLQANYDAELLNSQEEKSIQNEEFEVLSNLHDVASYLKKNNFIPSELTREQTVIQMRKYLKVSSLLGLRELAPTGAFRVSGTAAIDPDVLGAWLCLCKVQGNTENVIGSFRVENVNRLIDELKLVMCNPKADVHKTLKALFARYGIDFSIMHNFRGAPVYGYIDRKEDGTYKMVVTIRGSYADIFWFSLFHELGHIVNGDLRKPGSFIDANCNVESDQETAADDFACNALLDSSGYAAFVGRGSYSLSSIRSFAQAQKVPSYVVIGRLQKEAIIPWNRFASNKLRYKWAE